MKRKLTVMVSAILFCSSIFFSSCIGSFSLFNKLLAWNETINDKWVNELVFLVLTPVYGVAWFTDVVVLNSIEFWSGENPTQTNVQTKQVETENGLFVISTNVNGHTIRKADSEEMVEFRFNKDAKSWNLVIDGRSCPLLQFITDNQALVYLADGSTITVNRDQAGMMAFRRAIEFKTCSVSDM